MRCNKQAPKNLKFFRNRKFNQGLPTNIVDTTLRSMRLFQLILKKLPSIIDRKNVY